MRLHFFNSAVIENSKLDYSLVNRISFQVPNCLLLMFFFMDTGMSQDVEPAMLKFLFITSTSKLYLFTNPSGPRDQVFP